MQNWIRSGTQVEARFLFIYETTSVVRNRLYRREITQAEAEKALGILAGLHITYLHPPAIRQTHGNYLTASIAPRVMTASFWQWRSWKVAISGQGIGVFTTP
jgi:hypothetical protein